MNSIIVPDFLENLGSFRVDLKKATLEQVNNICSYISDFFEHDPRPENIFSTLSILQGFFWKEGSTDCVCYLTRDFEGSAYQLTDVYSDIFDHLKIALPNHPFLQNVDRSTPFTHDEKKDPILSAPFESIMTRLGLAEDDPNKIPARPLSNLVSYCVEWLPGELGKLTVSTQHILHGFVIQWAYQTGKEYSIDYITRGNYEVRSVTNLKSLDEILNLK